MNDQEFFDLAMKVIGRRSNDAERAEMEALLASRPELKAEFEKLQADARLAREALPLLGAVGSSAGEFPAYARERLQTKVRKTLGRHEAAQTKSGWNWRWLLGLATAAAAVVVLLLPLLTRPGTPVIQVAMVDTAGAVRGTDANDIGSLKQQWKGSTVLTFDQANQAGAWEASWPGGARVIVKVIYDRTAGEVRAAVRRAGKTQQKAFLVERDLATTLRQVDDFIREQTAK
jgi:hypothetical protein